jgi:aminoglycoside phosphotransferase (APT) family kinase protein
MPIPEQRDLEATRPVLAAWLADHLGASEVEVGPIQGPAFTGFSNETLLFDATFTPARGGPRRTEGLVVRVQPTAHTVFLEADFEWQYRVLDILGTHTDVPVPVVRAFESDPSVLGAPFFVMERIDGCRVPADSPPYTVGGWIHDDATPQQRRTLVESGLDALVAIHALDWRDLGLGFLDKPQYGALGFEQQLRYYEAAFEWAAEGEDQPVVGAALDWVRANAPAPGADPELTLCWGDARINNQLFDDDYHVRAVLDWEMVTIADPMMDLGWWLFLDRHFHEGCDRPRLDGFPTREEMVAHYEARSGRAARDLEFYEVFAGVRFGVVMLRIKSLLVEFELMAPDTDMGRNNIVTHLLADLLGLPEPGVLHHPWAS